MTTYNWPELRDRAIQAFNGDTPGARIEDAVLTHFREHPGRVATLIETIGRRVTEGQVRSGWAILRHELDTIPANISATDNRDRANALLRAEAWIRHAGGYLDRIEEIDDELFGDRGPLRHWPELRDQIHQLWHDQRPRFQATEEESERRQLEQAALRVRLRKATSSAITPALADEIATAVAADVTMRRDAIEQPPPIPDHEAEALAADLAETAA